MKVSKLIGAVLICTTGFLLNHADAAAWRLVAGQGARFFVAVDPGQANEAVYRDAAASVCAAGKACVVLFWTDPALAGTKMPLSAAQRQALAAQYTRNPASGHEDLQFRCTAGTPGGQRCLK